MVYAFYYFLELNILPNLQLAQQKAGSTLFFLAGNSPDYGRDCSE